MKPNHLPLACCLLVYAAVLGGQPTMAVPYSFSLASPSGLDFQELAIAVSNEGFLIGDFDADTNPDGTRTKPGLFGSFGPTENVPVNTDFNFSVAGAPQVPLEGGFQSQIDTHLLSISFSQYQADMVAGDTASLSLSIGLGTEGFRTQAPSSLYPPGFFNVPFGSATLTDLQLTQSNDLVTAALEPLGPDQYSFSTVLPVSLSFSVEILGSSFQVPGLPFALPILGTLDLSGGDAVLASTAELEGGQVLPLNVPLPEFTLPVPTLLPPGATATLVFNLTLTELVAALEGQLTTNAVGTIVPEPSNFILFWLAGLLVAVRRR